MSETNSQPSPNVKRALKPEERLKLFSEMLRRIRHKGGDPQFKKGCLSSPAKAKEMTQRVADELTMGVDLEDREVVVFVDSVGAADFCHVFSVNPKGGKAGPPYTANDFLLCCYELYNPASAQKDPINE